MSTACLAVALLALGWADVGIAPSKSDRSQSSFLRNIASIDRPSERTLETLKRMDREVEYKKDPPRTIAVLERAARSNPEPDLVYALAELSWIEGKRLDRKRKAEALERYVDAVAYAYDFLFDPDLASGRQPSDPRYRLACDLYNGGLDRLIRGAQSKSRIEAEGTIVLKAHGREQLFRVSLVDSAWTPSDIDQLLLASDYEVSGLPTKSYQYGLGVPLIAIHKTDREARPNEKCHPPEMAFPLTAFLRPNSKLRASGTSVEAPRECTLELIDPIRVHSVGTNPTYALETDYTTPLAYMWSKTDLTKFRWTGLLRPGEVSGRAGLMLLRPYERGKIPVVMVHGLASTPLAWIPMLNELLRDMRLQDRYQFMLYMYPTGVPLPIAAAGLREALLEAERTYSPTGGEDAAFSRMVLLGHSMGGLLSHAVSVDSRDGFWQLNSDRPIDEIIGPPEVLDTLKRYLFFNSLPFVRRVVFLATPHRGSDYSRRVVGRLSSGLISEPDQIQTLLNRLIKDNPDAFDRKQFRRLPTSIETLETDHPVLLSLLSMPPGKDVSYHSIIGSKAPGPRPTSSDGVVTYRSSHLDNVESELVVRSDHGVQKDQEAILEVRRILLKHIGIAAPGALPATANSAAANPPTVK